eukprot:COSAG05_NODE_927_length_6569_cov_13.038485_9_plen_39_part_00
MGTIASLGTALPSDFCERIDWELHMLKLQYEDVHCVRQ